MTPCIMQQLIMVINSICPFYFILVCCFVFQKFSYPLVMTLMHLLVKFILASCVRNLLECHQGKARKTLTWREFTMRMGPVGEYISQLPSTTYYYLYTVYIYSDTTFFIIFPCLLQGFLVYQILGCQTGALNTSLFLCKLHRLCFTISYTGYVLL